MNTIVSPPEQRSEKAKKDKQDLLDSKVAFFADQLLFEH